MRLRGALGLQDTAGTVEEARGAFLCFVYFRSRGPVKGSHTLGMNRPGDKSIFPSLVIDL